MTHAMLDGLERPAHAQPSGVRGRRGRAWTPASLACVLACSLAACVNKSSPPRPATASDEDPLREVIEKPATPSADASRADVPTARTDASAARATPRDRPRERGATPGRDAGHPGAGAGTWTIVLAVAEDEAGAGHALDMVRGRAGLRDAWIDDAGSYFSICVGRYESASAPGARTDLARLRAFEVDGSRPFATAVLAPAGRTPARDGADELDLAGVRAAQGKQAMYTLQVAVYTRPDRKAPSASELAEFRHAAEDAASQFRRGGEEAYYYHGPTASMVTIGVFTPRDYDPQDPARQSPALMDLRARHPYNLVNGKGLRERRAGEREWRMQPSFVAVIPER